MAQNADFSPGGQKRPKKVRKRGQNQQKPEFYKNRKKGSNWPKSAQKGPKKAIFDISF